MNDMFNTVENTIVTFLSSGGNGDISAKANYIHPKIMLDVQNYTLDQNRAVAVHSVGFIGDEDDRHNDGIRVYIEVSAHDGDVSDLDNDVKDIASDIINYLRAESPVNGGKGMLGVFDDIYVASADIFPFESVNGWNVRAGINIEVYLKAGEVPT